MNAEQLEEIKRHFSVVSETLRSDIRRIAELEIQTLLKLSFPQFDQHIHTLETDISALKKRMDHLETSRS